MKDYPQLAAMGVENRKQIECYAINSIDHIDILRIDYKRPKRSLMPSSRTYQFPRVQKVDNTGKSGFVMESDPAFRAAVNELKKICHEREHNKDFTGAILEELRLLEQDVAARSDYIKELVDKIKSA